MNWRGNQTGASSTAGQSKINFRLLNELICRRIETVVDALQIDLHNDPFGLSGRCPIHGGDNQGAFQFYPEGHTKPGHWVCRTHGCHEAFYSTALGFIRGVLSNHKLGWSGKLDVKRQMPMREVLDWVSTKLNLNLSDLKVDEVEEEKIRFLRQSREREADKKAEARMGISRDKVLKTLRIPSEYFLARGFSSDVLVAFDVGDYPVGGRDLSDRAVAPIYDELHQGAIGFSGRTIHPAQKGTPKWFHQGFESDKSLYAWWMYQETILRQHVVILVEGPGEVWRLHEAGLKNGLALYGKDLKPGQLDLLIEAGVMGVILLLNNDEAGRDGERTIRAKLESFFRVWSVFPSANDLAGETNEWISHTVGAVFDKAVALFKD